MTEPTHHLRPDVEALVRVILDRVQDAVTPLERELAQDRLRKHLANAWHEGWMKGHGDCHEGRMPSPNPYHETDKP